MGKRDTLMLDLDCLSAKIVNLKAGIQFQFSKNKKVLKRNKELKVNGSEADICFVLGNGPSLKKIDLKILEQFPCFTVNMFYKGVDNFQSAYHLFVDPGFGTDSFFAYVRQVYEKNANTKIILNDNFREKVQKEGLLDERTYFINLSYVSYGSNVRCDMQKGISGSLNVIPVAIECAVYMGYKRIYLLGCDFNSYAVAKNEHFYDAVGYEEKTLRGNIVGDLIRCALVHNQHYALDEYSRNRGIEIVNLTEGSLIDAYKRDSLENIL